MFVQAFSALCQAHQKLQSRDWALSSYYAILFHFLTLLIVRFLVYNTESWDEAREELSSSAGGMILTLKKAITVVARVEARLIWVSWERWWYAGSHETQGNCPYASSSKGLHEDEEEAGWSYCSIKSCKSLGSSTSRCQCQLIPTAGKSVCVAVKSFGGSEVSSKMRACLPEHMGTATCLLC